MAALDSEALLRLQSLFEPALAPSPSDPYAAASLGEGYERLRLGTCELLDHDVALRAEFERMFKPLTVARMGPHVPASRREREEQRLREAGLEAHLGLSQMKQWVDTLIERAAIRERLQRELSEAVRTQKGSPRRG